MANIKKLKSTPVVPRRVDRPVIPWGTEGRPINHRNESEIQGEIDEIESRYLTTKGEERVRLTLRHMLLLEELAELVSGRVVSGDADSCTL